MTTITITDPVLAKQLAEAKGPVEFRDAAGNVIHSTDGPGLWAPPEGYVPPFSEEEMTRFSQNREGRPLKDILHDLREKYGP
jgi:hypothetical protein